MAESGSPARFQLLGPVRLLDGDRPVPVGGPGVRGLLALLALKVNKVVALDEIIDALWGHDPPATARTIVHGNVSHLRRVLRGIQGDHPDGARILTAPPGYQLTVEPERIDVHRARSLLERASAEEPEKASALLTEALALWQGPALAGVPGSVRAPELEDLRLAVHGARVDADLELGRHAELIVELSPLVRANPLAERTAGQLMRALYHAGRRGDALELYRTVSRATLRTLGVEPGADLRWLHERVLNDDLPVKVVAEPKAEAAPVQQLPPAVPNLAGREADLAWLDELAERAEAGETAVGVVTGTAGIGKSSLVVWWAHRAGRRFPDGILFASLRGFDPHHPPLEPADLLTQFLLGLGVPAEGVPEQVHERVALYRSMIAGRRMLVILDNARSAEQVRPLLPPGSRSMTLVTSRSRLDGLAVSNAAKLRVLGTLAPGDAVRLIEELAGPAGFDLNHALARLCGYLPLALRIAGARLAASAQWSAQDLVDELGNERTRLAALDVEGPDDGVRAAFDVSFRGLPPEVADTFLRLGVVQCVSAGSHLTAAIGGITVAEARRHLRVLAAHNLLAETGRDSFVPHDLVRLFLRELAENELDEADREDVLSRSVRFYQAVADRARRKMLRIVDPLDFTGELTDAQTPPIGSFDEAQDWFTAEWENLIEVLEAARAAGRHDDVWRLARVAHTYRAVYPLLDEWTRLVEIGLEAAERSGDVLGRCWMLISRCAIALTFELPQGCLADAERALELATAIGDDRLTISANIHLGSALTLLGRHDEAIRTLRRVVEETERTGDLELRGQALNNCAEAEKRAGRFIEAIGHQVASLEIDRTLGDESYVVVSLNNLAELSLRIGELAAAERYVWEAVDLTISRRFVLQEGVLRLTLGRVLRAGSDVDGAREQFALALKILADANPKLAALVRAEFTDLGESP
ncbi:BTAD domain-containing putative transcriptional regulator [Amycolatopsis roodepoortensis]|uniref:DNA-binding SARP family transcriptional activator/tetratricopeptide (TPR) repeat protein n=1 Tax=Amycolatopsis roodepoortensis TaxID=700274 RepID=A0ABR9L7T8_9PSEU|nr:BTAD domain-containing putative transcriptional regulator [Amycolatopsis roodepoortensis]MBE1576630.1 DNA-binding SARP family transcriptional activator/tetratricopeptide (TPR) repeat protein [Amycolatopsis roodepoortensis]